MVPSEQSQSQSQSQSHSDAMENDSFNCNDNIEDIQQCIEHTASQNPKQVMYIRHPRTNKTLNVIDCTLRAKCNMCNSSHEVDVYTLEDNILAFYCSNYHGGHWIFKPS